MQGILKSRKSIHFGVISSKHLIKCPYIPHTGIAAGMKTPMSRTKKGAMKSGS